MILFIFEGSKTEPTIYNTIKELYFRDEEDIIYIFNSNIYSLYNRLKKLNSDFEEINNAADIIEVLKLDDINRDSLNRIDLSSEIDQVFLFFDYDFQHAFHVHKEHPEQSLIDILEEDNKRLKILLDFFNEETDMGKLYINYPMIESLKYTKILPDDNYSTYVTTLEECHGSFKEIADKMSDYKGFNGILIDKSCDIDNIKNTWEQLIKQNVKKANYICNGIYCQPNNKDEISQANIFKQQSETCNKESKIAILNSFPLFLYEYF